ncbi:tetratricopeptide repeat protein [Truepera radiovictrix]|uniref:Tetratricopeptide TPR_2 repeat protein n=1 Tax=Truepera radiovictrix (strain DSM 17093 / CIP 108686 / LMG 22925 / RQ-24) TaxID=649638 RepID=D7CV05_TRURR|nr:tetratricopeptide repeat protein [Truepera radiovictrix]ADI15832.1 Tetratricopeptide TPR_2 repeat protein [Truepera radiovictrix DSM 17093]WMT58541.1 tetratricopeptide repeat protein [Truepera radiovictrix]
MSGATLGQQPRSRQGVGRAWRKGRWVGAVLFVASTAFASAPEWAAQAEALRSQMRGGEASVPEREPPDAALAALEARVRSAPEDLNAWLDLGAAYLEAERFDRAKESFLEAIALDYLAADAHFGLGLSEYGRGDFDAALFAFSEVARLFPERFDGHFNRGVALARLRRPEAAVAAFEEALAQAGPETGAQARADAYVGLAGQLIALGRFEAAAEAYAEAIALTGDAPELVYARAEALYRAGRGIEALPALNALEAESVDYRVSALRADIYTQAGQTDYALRALQRAVRRAAEAEDASAEANLLIRLGLLQRSLGREAAATRAFGAAAQRAPDSGEALYNLGLSYLESGQPDRALEPLEGALMLQLRAQGEGARAAQGEVYLALAAAYEQLGRPNEARRSAEAAASRLADAALRLEASAILGRSLYALGEFRGALLALREVADARPEDANAQLWAGLAHYQRGEFEAAIARYERAVALDPNGAEARLNLGAAYLAAGRYEDAALVYELLTTQFREDPDAFYNLGWALLSQGRPDEARQAWERAVELGFEPARAALSQFF